jgi:hypothetical protein
MITSKTQAAIAVLNDIYAGGDIIRADACQLTEQDMDILLSKLLSAGLIKLSDKGDSRNMHVYSPARDSSDVSLLDILELLASIWIVITPLLKNFTCDMGKLRRNSV